MPSARPMPRKFLSVLEDARDVLRQIALQSRNALDGVENHNGTRQYTQNILRDIEASAYRVALDLSAIEVAGGCDSCPAAPPVTEVEAHLLVLAGQLEEHAEHARNRVQMRAQNLQDEEDSQ